MRPIKPGAIHHSPADLPLNSKIQIDSIVAREKEAQRLLASQGIATSIELQIEAAGAIAIGVEAWHSDAVLKALRNRLR
ncbi:hypothetical protein C1Y32_29475 [Pseudomonas sp. FW126-L8]|nr:hypothetical protein C1Y32_29475 [Pseudomonas sp. FW126-L8]